MIGEVTGMAVIAGFNAWAARQEKWPSEEGGVEYRFLGACML